jgi:hypothetical protein
MSFMVSRQRICPVRHIWGNAFHHLAELSDG